MTLPFGGQGGCEFGMHPENDLTSLCKIMYKNYFCTDRFPSTPLRYNNNQYILFNKIFLKSSLYETSTA